MALLPFLTQSICRRGRSRGPGGPHPSGSGQLGTSSASHLQCSTRSPNPTSCGRGDFINYANVSREPGDSILSIMST